MTSNPWPAALLADDSQTTLLVWADALEDAGDPACEGVRELVLAADGAVSASFKPALTLQQYMELLAIASGDYRTSAELCDAVREAAERWCVECIIDGC